MERTNDIPITDSRQRPSSRRVSEAAILANDEHESAGSENFMTLAGISPKGTVKPMLQQQK